MLRALCLVSVLAACVLPGCENRRVGQLDREAAKALFDEVPLPAPPGMSDLTIDDRGVLWAVAERDRTVLEIDLAKQPVTPIAHPLDGMTLGFDAEAIAWLGNGTFALGVEGAFAPSAAIVFAERRGDALVVTSTRPLKSSDLGVSLTTNHGVEAICGRDGELLAAVETVGTANGKRWAPIVRLRGDAITVTRLWLTSNVGKISALSCTIADDGTAQVIAIERHFGVSRILRFTVARTDVEVTPAIEIDLDPVLHNSFNLEGITRLPDGRIVTINDNQGKTVKGPTALFVFHPR